MPVSLTFESQEAIPEGLKDHAVEKDGKWIFEAETAAEVANLKKTVKAERDRRVKYEGELTRFEKLKEFDDDGLSELLTLRELKKQGKPLTVDEKAEIERLHKKALDKLNADLTTERESRKSDQAQLKRFKLTDPIRAIATSDKVGMFPEDFDLAWSEIGSRFKLVEEEGKKARIVVLDEDGDETDVKVEDFFTKLYQQQRPKFFKASNTGGSGAHNNHKSSGSGVHRLSREDAKNPARYRAAKEAAQKAGVELQLID